MKAYQESSNRWRMLFVGAVAALAHLWLFSWSNLSMGLTSMWEEAVNLLDDGMVPSMDGLVLVVCALAAAVIWVLSGYVTWRAFRLSGKKAYIFILLFLAIPVLPQIGAKVAERYAPPPLEQAAGQEWHGRTPQDPELGDTIYVPREAHSVTVIHVPLAQFLLLVGLWGLCQSEAGKGVTREPGIV